ncbi:hypothetical protein SAMN04487944_109149 [Gracilibacillus ureilyticus]|uniref:Uncharacterized protein n=2 Tax=Gracilibacillus ureilyticus TaxID=531814 RepID=A0A1H9RU32_9BACI|nr:hypothetical protein SAMN04487944_109149 [Gracilibacillus ureilyticus]
MVGCLIIFFLSLHVLTLRWEFPSNESFLMFGLPMMIGGTFLITYLFSERKRG